MSEVMLTAVRRQDQLPPPPEDRFVALRRGAQRAGQLPPVGPAPHGPATEQLAESLRTALAHVPEPSVEALDVRAAMTVLDELDREILTLTAWEGLTSGEIAAAVGLPSSTVRARLARARSLLRSQLTQAPSESARGAS
jgi:RNA polymerase sigma-70 factor (ECF subfamily)